MTGPKNVLQMKPELLQQQKIILGLGEILWDLLPAGKQLGGAPANFAYHAHALGAEAWPVSRVGNDPLGREIVGRLSTLGLPTETVQVDPTAPTGTVSVELAADGQPRFTIHEDVAWDRLTADKGALALAHRVDAVCFGSLAQRREPSRSAIRQILAATPPEALRVFDINLRQHFHSPEVIDTSLRLANVLKLNDAELPTLGAVLGLSGRTDEQLAELARRYDLRLVALTRGAKGSLLYAEGRWADCPGQRVQVQDTVGAGDAFTAAMVLGFLAHWDLAEIDQRASDVAAFVCSQPGATPQLPVSLREAFAAGNS
jgi:fructokinase